MSSTGLASTVWFEQAVKIVHLIGAQTTCDEFSGW